MRKKTFCFDIDGVIATLVDDLNYKNAKPKEETIKKINELHAMGHKIILFTARGSLTKKDWREVTELQMRLWGVKYDKLLFGKPAADYYIDDKMVSLNEIKKLLIEK